MRTCQYTVQMAISFPLFWKWKLSLRVRVRVEARLGRIRARFGSSKSFIGDCQHGNPGDWLPVAGRQYKM